MLIARAQRDLGHPDEALQAGYQLAELSKQADKRELQAQAEELLGTVYLQREDFPQAFDHFQSAFTLAGDGKNRPYEAVHEADIFIRVGRFADAERMLALALPSNPYVPELRVQMLLEQRKFAEAEILAARVAKEPGLPADVQYDLAVDRAIAQAFGGHARSAVTTLPGIAAAEGTPGDPASVATHNLNTGTVCLAAGDAECAFYAAATAESYFSSAGLKDSDFRSALIAARAARLRHDAVNEKLFTQKSIDILTELRNTWSPQLFQSYNSRPDIQSLGREFLHLSQ